MWIVIISSLVVFAATFLLAEWLVDDGRLPRVSRKGRAHDPMIDDREGDLT